MKSSIKNSPFLLPKTWLHVLLDKNTDLCSSCEFWLFIKHCDSLEKPSKKSYASDTSITPFRMERIWVSIKRLSYILRTGIWDLKLLVGRPVFLAVWKLRDILGAKQLWYEKKYPHIGTLAIYQKKVLIPMEFSS